MQIHVHMYYVHLRNMLYTMYTLNCAISFHMHPTIYMTIIFKQYSCVTFKDKVKNRKILYFFYTITIRFDNLILSILSICQTSTKKGYIDKNIDSIVIILKNYRKKIFYIPTCQTN